MTGNILYNWQLQSHLNLLRTASEGGVRGRSAYRSHRVGHWKGMAAGSYREETPLWPWLDPVKVNILMKGAQQRVSMRTQ